MIRAANLFKSYTKTLVLQNFSFQAADQERLAILGPSGSGKTTLLRLVAGLELPDGGEIDLDGCPANRPGWSLPPYARSIGYAFQSPTLWPHMTVLQNLTFVMNGAAQAMKQKEVDGLAQAFELNGLLQRYPGQLSGGEARRVALARALAPRPRLLLLDEPLTSLNHALKDRIFEMLQASLADFRPTLLYVTHDPDEAVGLGARSIYIEQGRLVE